MKQNTWKPIKDAPRDGSWIIVPGEPVAMKWLSFPAQDGFDGCDLWVWADETLCDIEPDPKQPVKFMLWPED